jgi:23S rRNA (cytidine1920-2'-O)/16S rRNA (cytidine1409-2'-O)-methyltransferase
MDVSFISIKLILPVVCGIMGETGRVVTLIKPQFEAGREHVGKHGVVRDSAVHERVLADIRDFAQSMGWGVRRMTWSPVTGPKGNIEFLADIRHGALESGAVESDIPSLVARAHRALADGS